MYMRSRINLLRLRGLILHVSVSVSISEILLDIEAWKSLPRPKQGRNLCLTSSKQFIHDFFFIFNLI
jgi:hypothetical protein